MIRFARVLLAPALVLALSLPALAEDAAPGAEEATRLVKQLAGRRAEKVASQLADMGKDALQAIKEGLQHRKWQIRYWAAYALAYSKAAKDGGGVEALKPLLDDKDQRVQLRGAMALARLGDKSGLDKAREAVKSRKAHIRAEALAALASSGDAEVVPTLKDALSDSNAKVRYWALLGLRDLGGAEALPTGLRFVKDKNAEVQTAALEILGAQGKGDPKVEDAVLALLSSKAALVRQQAASVLARLGSKKSLPQLRKVRDGDRSSEVKSVAEAAVVEISKRLKKD